MEFPRHLHKENGLFVVVENAEQYDACKGAGWADQPAAHVEQPQEVRFGEAIGSEPAEEAPKKKGKKG